MASNGISPRQTAILKAAAEPMKPSLADAADVAVLIVHHLLKRGPDGYVAITQLGEQVLADNTK